MAAKKTAAATDQAAPYQADIERFGSEVYDGRRCLGRVYDDGCRCVAQLADGRDLGSFTDRSAAVNAVIASAKATAQ